MRSRRQWLATATLSCAVAFSSSARAEPTSEDKAAAESLFNEGKTLVDKGDFPTACRRFEASQKLDPQIGTLLYLATCHEQQKLTATAWIEFQDALRDAQAANKADRIQQAKDGVARTEAVLSKVIVVVTDGAPSEVVRINGKDVAAFDAELPFNPGTLMVEATAPGRKAHKQQVELEPGPTKITITIPKLAAADGPIIEKPQLPKKPEKDHTIAYIVGASGLGVAAAGFAFGGAAWATNDAADEHCDGKLCNQDGLDLHDRANAFAWASNVLLVTGALATGAGVVLFFVWPPDGGGGDPKPTGKLALLAAPGALGAQWIGAFP